MKLAFVIALLLLPSLGQAKRNRKNLVDATEAARTADTALTSNPNLTAEKTTQLRREKAGAVDTIEYIANQDPKDTETQLDVSRSLASVSEAPRAIPFAERGLRLAETSGDPKLVRDALLTGSEVYLKAGNYELARERAQRILKTNPRDPDAMALYMQVKGRGTASTGKTGSGAAGTMDGPPGKNAAGGNVMVAGLTPTSGVAMTSAGALESRRQIGLGLSRMKLDPAAALKNFDAAVAADRGAAARVERSKARLAAGDAAGALEDAEAAVAIDPKFGAAYAARAEARSSMGRAAAGILADYEAAAKLDGGFVEAYKAALVRSGAATSAGAQGAAGGENADDIPRGILSRSPQNWGTLALIAVFAGGLGCVLAPLILKRRRSGQDDSPPR